MRRGNAALRLVAANGSALSPDTLRDEKGRAYEMRVLRLALQEIYAAANSWAFVRQKLLAARFELAPKPKPGGEPRLAGVNQVATEGGDLVYRQRHYLEPSR